MSDMILSLVIYMFNLNIIFVFFSTELQWVPREEKIAGVNMTAVRYASMVNVSGELKDCVYKQQSNGFNVVYHHMPFFLVMP